MRQFINAMKRSEIITGAIFVALGLVLLIWPGASVVFALRGIGILLLLYGITQIVTYLRNDTKNFLARGMLTVGVVAAVIGLWITLKPEVIISALPIIAGIIIALHGVQNIVQAFTLKKQLYHDWWSAAIIGIVTVILGVILFCNPFETIKTLIRAIGIFMICDGGSNIWIQSKIHI